MKHDDHHHGGGGQGKPFLPHQLLTPAAPRWYVRVWGLNYHCHGSKKVLRKSLRNPDEHRSHFPHCEEYWKCDGLPSSPPITTLDHPWWCCSLSLARASLFPPFLWCGGRESSNTPARLQQQQHTQGYHDDCDSEGVGEPPLATSGKSSSMEERGDCFAGREGEDQTGRRREKRVF